MKIVIINGSPRKNGVTAEALHIIENDLVSEGINVEFYNLSEINMSRCIGCCSCYTIGCCCIKDDAEKLSQIIAESDGLVFGSPTYASNISGLMKDFIDRGHFVIEQLLHDKYCVTVATGENYGNKNTSKILKNLVLYSGGKICDNITFNVPFNDIDFVRDKLKHRCRQSSKKILASLKGKKRFPLQTVIHNIVLTIGLRPLIKRKGALYQGVIDKWKSKGLTI